MFRYYEDKYGAYQARQLMSLPFWARQKRVRLLERHLTSTTDTSVPLWPEFASLHAEHIALREKAVSAITLKGRYEFKLQDLRVQYALLDSASAGEEEKAVRLQLEAQFAETKNKLRRATEHVEIVKPELKAVEENLRKTIQENEALLREQVEAVRAETSRLRR